MKSSWDARLQLTFTTGKAIYLQIAEHIIDEIRRGRLHRGDVLPSTRALATQLSVNRNTIVLAYEELHAHGWINARYKSSTCVSETLPPSLASRIQPPVRHHHTAVGFNHFEFPKPNEPKKKGFQVIFDDGLPDVKLAPLLALSREYKRIFQQKTRWQLLGYHDERGDEKLVQAILHLLSQDRGLAVAADNICITRGSQMALYLAARVLLHPGDEVAVEHPGYKPAWHAFSLAGARLQTIPVDEGGIDVAAIARLCKKKKLKALYVTPHHQYPTTATMKMDRRMQLLALSEQYNFMIIEDDYDHEYHFGAQSMLPLASMDQSGHVIYIGTLSKLVAPAVRIGFLSGPASFMQSVLAYRGVIDRQGDPVMEQALANLLLSGEIRKHTRKAVNVYRQRRTAAGESIRSLLPGFADYALPEGGMGLWLPLPPHITPSHLIAHTQQAGVSIVSPEKYFSPAYQGPTGIRLGYASLNEKAFEKGLRVLAGAL
ncbi:PLP-dependent aminotransferase family protein [Chitinophaga pendula]|uniref:MocR-like pyridoxine biosynthesis transcription factor PdxR n=1 Tax=Chitinophaga TaxID=79328 RepID=UPI0018DFB21C|nr:MULTISPECIES: PLP-dependent aminotransferase family protein [Chitinophaga]UCJ08588.1 PLP-dependent aminotransferase family protein [Chitinophaga pendula]